MPQGSRFAERSRNREAPDKEANRILKDDRILVHSETAQKTTDQGGDAKPTYDGQVGDSSS